MNPKKTRVSRVGTITQEEDNLNLSQQPGYKRLAIGIPSVVFIATFFYAIVDGANLFQAVRVAAICSAIAFALIRITYWIIDGFKIHK